jgi:hypothetical protein
MVRSTAKPCVSNHESPAVEPVRASWFETAQERLLTMRVWQAMRVRQR